MKESARVLSEAVNDADRRFLRSKNGLKLCVVEPKLLATAMNISSDDSVLLTGELADELITILIENGVDVIL